MTVFFLNIFKFLLNLGGNICITLKICWGVSEIRIHTYGFNFTIFKNFLEFTFVLKTFKSLYFWSVKRILNELPQEGVETTIDKWLFIVFSLAVNDFRTIKTSNEKTRSSRGFFSIFLVSKSSARKPLGIPHWNCKRIQFQNMDSTSKW